MIQAERIWMDGKLVPYAEATVHVGAFGLHYGLGVFEGVRCYRRANGQAAIFRLKEHIDRLFDSARVCEMEIPHSRTDLMDACVQTVRANRLSEAYIRPLAFTGAGALGIGARQNPIHVVVLAFAWDAVLGAEAANKGIRAHVSSFVRGHPNATLNKAKIAGQYVSSVLVKRDSQRLGLEEAILLDAAGNVAEGSAQNLFMVKDGVLWTPPTDLPILPGITRSSVLTLAGELGLPLRERAFPRDSLYLADEVFFTGTATELTPVRQIDGRPIGEGQPGPITRRIQQAFFEVARGTGGSHPDWLTAV